MDQGLGTFHNGLNHIVPTPIDIKKQEMDSSIPVWRFNGMILVFET